MISNLVRDAYSDPNVFLVFPSEVAARFWQRWYVSHGTTRTLLTERCVSWDSFKERFLAVRSDRKPASRLTRHIFARRFLAANASRPALRTLVSPAYADVSENVAPALSAALPSLYHVVHHANFHQIEADLIADFKSVYSAYSSFLAEYGVFEPDWEFWARVDRGGMIPDFGRWKPRVFFPELLDDYHTYERLLSEKVQTVSVNEIHQQSATETTPADEYPEYRSEIASVFDQIEELLATGVRPQAIVITATEAADIQDIFESESAIRSIPLRVQSGRSVLESPGGSVFLRIDEALSTDFSIRELSGVVLDRSIPWRDEYLHTSLAAFGYESHCYSRQEWKSAFALTGTPHANLATYFNTLVGGMLRLTRAKSFSELRLAVRQFMDTHLDHSRWDERAEAVYETVLTVLSGAADEGDSLLGKLSPWRLFLQVLRERRYVPRAPGGSVAFYDYRVGAGIEPEYHFVVGASQSATTVAEPAPIGIRGENREMLGFGKNDRSRAFLRAFRFSGRDVRFSVSRVSPRGAHIAAADLEPRPGKQTADPDSWWWDGTASPPSALSSAAREGLIHYLATGFEAPAVNYQNSAVTAEAEDKLKPLDHLSATSLDRYQACPFSFFLRYRLGLDSEAYGFRGVEPRIRGILYHRLLELVASRQRDDEAIAVLALRETKRPGVARYVPRWYLPAFARRAAADVAWTVDAVADLLGGTPGQTEKSLSATVHEVPLRGTIDRYSAGDRGATVVDYKTGRSPTFRDVWGSTRTAAEPRLSEATHLQLPFYAVLAEAAMGQPVVRLSLVLPRDRRVKMVADETARDSAAKTGGSFLAAARSALPDYIASVWDAMQSGDFRCGEARSCSGCAYRAVCRRCFVVRQRDGHS